MKTGFIGVGKMGSRMAVRLLQAGFSLVVHDVSQDVAAPLLEKGAAWGSSPREVANLCDVICVSLPGPAELREVALGERGILAGVRPNSIVIDHTTSSPTLARQVHEALRKKGAGMLDAPVSGGVGGAEQGTLTALVGGDAGTLETCTPLLRAYSGEVFHVGEVGAGCICNVLHNLAVLSANLATVECLVAGVKAGVDAKILIEVFQKCALGKNLDLQVSLPATLFQGDFEPRFSLRLAHKDMKLAAELVREQGVPTPVNDICEKEMDEAMSRGWGDRDNSIFLTLQEERAGVQVRTT